MTLRKIGHRVLSNLNYRNSFKEKLERLLEIKTKEMAKLQDRIRRNRNIVHQLNQKVYVRKKNGENETCKQHQEIILKLIKVMLKSFKRQIRLYKIK